MILDYLIKNNKLEYDTIKKGRPIVGVRFNILNDKKENAISQSNFQTI